MNINQEAVLELIQDFMTVVKVECDILDLPDEGDVKIALVTPVKDEKITFRVPRRFVTDISVTEQGIRGKVYAVKKFLDPRDSTVMIKTATMNPPEYSVPINMSGSVWYFNLGEELNPTDKERC